MPLVDQGGSYVGRILYDGFGGVLSSTLPFTPNSLTGGTADAVTGLVHVGDGRWLDPALGRPLQPNPNGGPPTVPQALNRFTATPLGQPGVFQAARTDGFNWTPPVASFVYGTTTQLVGKLHHIVGYEYAGSVIVSAAASHSALTKWQRGNSLFRSPEEAFTNSGRTFYRTTGVVPLTANSQDELAAAAARVVGEIEAALPKRAPWTAQVTGDLIGGTAQPLYSRFEDVARFSRSVPRIGAGLDFAIGAGFQLANDYGSPYLTPTQVGARAVIAGGGSAFSGFVGGLVGGAAIGWLCGPGVVVCAPVGAVGGAIVGGLMWSKWGQPVVFSAPFLQPADRNLLPLN